VRVVAHARGPAARAVAPGAAPQSATRKDG
jgi:hypothetical protein